MPRNWEQSKEASPLGVRLSSKVHPNVDNRRLRYPTGMTTKPRARRSTSRGFSRRSRTPRQKKSLTPQLKRRGITPEKRPLPRSIRTDSRTSAQIKRPRVSPRIRKPSPPRRLSRDRPHSYTVSKEPLPEKPRSVPLSSFNKRDEVNDRFHGGGKYISDRPMFRGPEKGIIQERDSMKKIVTMRDMTSGGDRMKPNVVGGDMNRRTVTARGSRDYRELDNGRMSRPVKYDITPQLWNNQRTYSYGRTDNHEEPARYTSDGSRALFERDDVNNRRKFEENERDRRRGVTASVIHTDRRYCEPNTANDNFRTRGTYYDDDRNARNREYTTLRPSPREFDSRAYDRPREETSRDDLFIPPPNRARSRSFERGRDPPDRKDRYDERGRIFRRSLERLPMDDRVVRRHPSPGDARRHFDDYRLINDRRDRSMDRRDVEPLHYRDNEYTTTGGDRFSGVDFVPKNQGYYENEFRNTRMVSPARDRGRTVSYRGRGLTTSRPFTRSTDVVMGPAMGVRPADRESVPFPARDPPSAGRRMPFATRKPFRDTFDGRH